MELYLTKQYNGLYSLSKLRPSIARIYGTRHEDVYFVEGEPIGVRNLCPFILLVLKMEDIPILVPTKIEINGGLIAS